MLTRNIFIFNYLYLIIVLYLIIEFTLQFNELPQPHYFRI